LKVAYEITSETVKRTTKRTEIFEYPLEAIRELVLNAIIHRKYNNPIDIQIKIFDNRITIFNPGELYGNITIEDLKRDDYQASARNKLIVEAFNLTGDIEKYGTGYVRIRKSIKEYPTMKFVYRETQGGYLAELSYENQKEYFKTDVLENVLEKDKENDLERLNRTALKSSLETEKSSLETANGSGINKKRSVKILKIIEHDPFITIPKIAELMGISTRAIDKNNESLKKDGYIERIGPNKGGHWKVIKYR